MEFKEIDVKIGNGVQIIKFNRPHKKNSFSPLMYDEVTRALAEGAKNPDVVITAMTGVGDYYSSGTQLEFPKHHTQTDLKVAKEKIKRVHSFICAFIDYPKILVAVVNGPAIGIAVTTLGLCDVVYASHKATFSTPFVKLGMCAEGCSTFTFPRIMGTSLASEVLYLGRTLDASEAKSCGLVSQVYAHANLNDEVWPRIMEHAKNPARSMHYSKRLVRGWDKKNLHEASDRECKQLEERWLSKDMKAAVDAFFSKHSKM